METKNPREMKRMGRGIRHFDGDIWRKISILVNFPMERFLKELILGDGCGIDAKIPTK